MARRRPETPTKDPKRRKKTSVLGKKRPNEVVASCKYLVYMLICCFNYSRIALFYSLCIVDVNAHAAVHCMTRADCSNRGECISNNCVCDAGFTGTNCETRKDEAEHLQSHICDNPCVYTFLSREKLFPKGHFRL